MGERIVRQFGLSDSVDTLGRWMAHRVAELMDRAERAKTSDEGEAARRECSDLIIKLWERRSYWPHGQPLAEVAGLLKNLIDVEISYGSRHERHEVEIDSHSWIGILPRLSRLQEREKKVCRDTALADFNLKAQRDWLEQHAKDLSVDEREIFETMIRARERLDESYFKLDETYVPNFTSLTPVERSQLAHEALEKINEERRKLLSSVQPKRESREKRKKTKPSASPARRKRDASQQPAPRATKKSAVKKKGSAKKRTAKKATRQ